MNNLYINLYRRNKNRWHFSFLIPPLIDDASVIWIRIRMPITCHLFSCFSVFFLSLTKNETLFFSGLLSLCNSYQNDRIITILFVLFPNKKYFGSRANRPIACIWVCWAVYFILDFGICCKLLFVLVDFLFMGFCRRLGLFNQ